MKQKIFVIACLLVLIVTPMFAMGSGETSSNGKSEKVIRVGTSAAYPPWAFQENDELKGYEIDVWNEIAKRTGYKIEWKLGQFSGLVGMLDAKEIDSVAHQMSITPQRLEKYVFSSEYAYSYYDFFVKDGSPIKTKEDLKGKKVACWLGGNGERTLRAVNDKYNLELVIVTYDGAPMENEILIGRIDAAWQGEVKTLSTIKKNNFALHQLKERLTHENNAYPFRKGEYEAMAKEVSKAIDSMRKDGTLKKLSEKWFFGVDVTENK